MVLSSSSLASPSTPERTAATAHLSSTVHRNVLERINEPPGTLPHLYFSRPVARPLTDKVRADYIAFFVPAAPDLPDVSTGQRDNRSLEASISYHLDLRGPIGSEVWLLYFAFCSGVLSRMSGRTGEAS
jgi:hypothetical protein